MYLSTTQLLVLIRLYYEKLSLTSRSYRCTRTSLLYTDKLMGWELITGADTYFAITDKGVEVLHSYTKQIWLMFALDNGMWHEFQYFVTCLGKEELPEFLVHEYQSVREVARKRWDVLASGYDA